MATNPTNTAPAETPGNSITVTAASNAPTTATKSVRWWLPFVIVLAVLSGLAIVRFQFFPLQPPVPALPAAQPLVVRYVPAQPLDSSQRSPGPVYIAEVKGDNELNLSFEVGGVVELIGPAAGKTWTLGTSLPRGTVLAQLKPDDFNNRIKAARARADLAKVTHQRMTNLVKTDAVPQQQLDQATTELKAANADLAAAEQALNDTVLRAPEDGTILERMISPAETAMPGRPVLRFSNLRRMTVEVGVPDTIIGHVQVGQDMAIAISALAGKTFTGQVSQVAVAGDGSRLFKVKIKVPNAEGQIKSGMTASVSLANPDRVPPGSVWVPVAALTAAPSAAGTDLLAVYVVEADGKARKRIVKTDEIAGNLVMVTRGLKAGEKVVVAGVGTLHEAAAVDARPAQEWSY